MYDFTYIHIYIYVYMYVRAYESMGIISIIRMIEEDRLKACLDTREKMSEETPKKGRGRCALV
jgi:hypothetical protein